MQNTQRELLTQHEVCQGETSKKQSQSSTKAKKSAVNTISQHNDTSDNESDHNRQRIAALQKEVNELKSSLKTQNKSQKSDSKKKGKKKKEWKKEEDEQYFATKSKEDYEDYPTMAEWQKKKDDGDLDDDKKCRFCGHDKHTVNDCKKLKQFREKLKLHKLINIVAIIADNDRELPYFTFEVQTDNKRKSIHCMLDTCAETSVISYNLTKKLKLTLQSTNMQIQGAGGQMIPIEFVTAIPIIIDEQVYHISALVSHNDYFKDKTILGKQFFTNTDLYVRTNSADE